MTRCDIVFFFKQKTAYEMRISDWSSDVCSSDLQWPLFGQLAKLQRSVFVDRKARTSHLQASELGRRLAAGDSMILFPEGTSDDGNRILPFKSALLSVAELEEIGRASGRERVCKYG